MPIPSNSPHGAQWLESWRYLCLILLSFRLSNNQLWRVTWVTYHGNVGNVPLLLSFAWVLLHPALRQLHRKYGRSAFRIATMKLPPIWESGSVWKLGMPGKMKVYKNHADTFDLMCLVEMSLQHVHTEIQSCFLAVFVFLDHCEPSRCISKLHKHYFTCQALDNSQKDSVSG